MAASHDCIEPPGGIGRGAPRRSAPASLAPVAVGLLLAGLLLGCASGRTIPEDPTQPREIDYRERHERMLEVVIERPLIMEMQRQERERRAQRDYRSTWEAIAARQRAYDRAQQQRQQKSTAFFQDLQRRQQEHSAERERVRTERWARFMEENPPDLLAPDGAGEPPPP